VISWLLAARADPEPEESGPTGAGKAPPDEKHLDEDLDAMHDRLAFDPDAFRLK
jgi:hypothetical protein